MNPIANLSNMAVNIAEAVIIIPRFLLRKDNGKGGYHYGQRLGVGVLGTGIYTAVMLWIMLSLSVLFLQLVPAALETSYLASIRNVIRAEKFQVILHYPWATAGGIIILFVASWLTDKLDSLFRRKVGWTVYWFTVTFAFVPLVLALTMITLVNVSDSTRPFIRKITKNASASFEW